MTSSSTQPPIRKPDPLMAVVLGWAIPGAGHILIGQVRKGVFFFVILLVTFIAGLFLADFRTVRASDNPFYFVGQLGSGLNLLLTALSGNLRPREWVSPVYFEPGLLYMSVSGLLNVLVVMAIFPQPTQPVGKSLQAAAATEGARERQG